MKTLILPIIFLTLLGCNNVSEKQNKSPFDKPNVIVFLVDDLGWNDTSLPFAEETTAYNKRYRTPNLEKLATQGVTFTNALFTSALRSVKSFIYYGPKYNAL